MKNKILPVITIVIIIIAICVIAFIPKNKEESSKVGGTTNTTTNKVTNSISKQAKRMDATTNTNGDIEVKVEDIEKDSATFINYTSDGVNMELVAIMDEQNNIDIAFNTCQVCNGAPEAYFIQKNGKLICQNCGNVFTLKSIGGLAYGCNPMTLSNNDITKTDTGIIIRKEFLNGNKNLFINVAKH